MINRNRRALGAVLAVCIAVMTAGCAVLADKRSPDSSFGYEDVREQETEQTEQSLSALPEVGEKDASCQIWNRGLPEDTILPRSYDYREEGRAPQIGNQGSLGTCWAFASLTALESSLLPEKNESFSVDHMSMHNNYTLGQDEGGEYTMSMAYLLGWQGPV